jgi:hypothetical protein
LGDLPPVQSTRGIDNKIGRPKATGDEIFRFRKRALARCFDEFVHLKGKGARSYSGWNEEELPEGANAPKPSYGVAVGGGGTCVRLL